MMMDENFDDLTENGEDNIQEFMDEEIKSAPQAPEMLERRLAEHNSSSPSDSGGDIDAAWEDVNSTGSESAFGDSPTPDQSDVEANAHAMGIDFDDDEPLDFEGKLEKRDEDRWELNEDSVSEDETI